MGRRRRTKSHQPKTKDLVVTTVNNISSSDEELNDGESKHQPPKQSTTLISAHISRNRDPTHKRPYKRFKPRRAGDYPLRRANASDILNSYAISRRSKREQPFNSLHVKGVNNFVEKKKSSTQQTTLALRR